MLPNLSLPSSIALFLLSQLVGCVFATNLVLIFPIVFLTQWKSLPTHSVTFLSFTPLYLLVHLLTFWIFLWMLQTSISCTSDHKSCESQTGIYETRNFTLIAEFLLHSGLVLTVVSSNSFSFSPARIFEHATSHLPSPVFSGNYCIFL